MTPSVSKFLGTPQYGKIGAVWCREVMWFLWCEKSKNIIILLIISSRIVNDDVDVEEWRSIYPVVVELLGFLVVLNNEAKDI